MEATFNQIDSNHDGVITRAEFEGHQAAARAVTPPVPTAQTIPDVVAEPALSTASAPTVSETASESGETLETVGHTPEGNAEDDLGRSPQPVDDDAETPDQQGSALSGRSHASVAADIAELVKQQANLEQQRQILRTHHELLEQRASNLQDGNSSISEEPTSITATPPVMTRAAAEPTSPSSPVSSSSDIANTSRTGDEVTRLRLEIVYTRSKINDLGAALAEQRRYGAHEEYACQALRVSVQSERQEAENVERLRRELAKSRDQAAQAEAASRKIQSLLRNSEQGSELLRTAVADRNRQVDDAENKVAWHAERLNSLESVHHNYRSYAGSEVGEYRTLMQNLEAQAAQGDEHASNWELEAAELSAIIANLETDAADRDEHYAMLTHETISLRNFLAEAEDSTYHLRAALSDRECELADAMQAVADAEADVKANVDGAWAATAVAEQSATALAAAHSARKQAARWEAEAAAAAMEAQQTAAALAESRVEHEYTARWEAEALAERAAEVIEATRSEQDALAQQTVETMAKAKEEHEALEERAAAALMNAEGEKVKALQWEIEAKQHKEIGNVSIARCESLVEELLATAKRVEEVALQLQQDRNAADESDAESVHATRLVSTLATAQETIERLRDAHSSRQGSPMTAAAAEMAVGRLGAMVAKTQAALAQSGSQVWAGAVPQQGVGPRPPRPAPSEPAAEPATAAECNAAEPPIESLTVSDDSDGESGNAKELMATMRAALLEKDKQLLKQAHKITALEKEASSLRRSLAVAQGSQSRVNGESSPPAGRRAASVDTASTSSTRRPASSLRVSKRSATEDGAEKEAADVLQKLLLECGRLAQLQSAAVSEKEEADAARARAQRNSNVKQRLEQEQPSTASSESAKEKPLRSLYSPETARCRLRAWTLTDASALALQQLPPPERTPLQAALECYAHGSERIVGKDVRASSVASSSAGGTPKSSRRSAQISDDTEVYSIPLADQAQRRLQKIKDQSFQQISKILPLQPAAPLTPPLRGAPAYQPQARVLYMKTV